MKLLVDAMCGDLVPYLRLCNHDTVFALDRDIETDRRLLAVASAEDRTIITRDRDLARQARDAVFLERADTDAQLRGLLAAGVDLSPATTPQYCGQCNGPLVAVPADRSTPDYAPSPAERDCWRCQDCGQYFWKGSHWERMTDRLAGLATE